MQNTFHLFQFGRLPQETNLESFNTIGIARVLSSERLGESKSLEFSIHSDNLGQQLIIRVKLIKVGENRMTHLGTKRGP